MPAEAEERAVAPRHEINVSSSVLVTVASATSLRDHYQFFSALILDVSLTGVALVVSATDARELQDMAGEVIMKLLLPLQGTPVEAIIEPVRYIELENPEGAFLVGCQIVDMQPKHRRVFNEFLSNVES